MNSSKGILDKINGDTQIVVDKIIAEAEIKAQAIIDKADKTNKAIEADCVNSLSKAYDEIISRRETVARLDAKKIVMHAKKQAMDEIFMKAKQAIIALPDKEYLKIIENMIVANASDGDKVIPSAIDIKRVTVKFVKNIATKNNLNIELSDKVGEFEGGLILESVNFDKNLTLDAELDALRNDAESEYADKIFEE